MNLFYQPNIPEGLLHLEAEESRHCVKVLRKRAGDVIHITDGRGCFYQAVIAEADPVRCIFHVRERIEDPKRNYAIHIAISPTKNADRIEWFVEKTVEFGVDKITLLECENTERTYIKTERLEKVAVSAMKQSLKARLPEITSLTPFDNIIATPSAEGKFIASVDQSNPTHLKDLAGPAAEYLVLIGPEGDFSSRELSTALQRGFHKVSLGQSRLRTETAGIAACHILNLVNH